MTDVILLVRPLGSGVTSEREVPLNVFSGALPRLPFLNDGAVRCWLRRAQAGMMRDAPDRGVAA